MNILVNTPNWLGDLVMSYPFLYELRKKYPTATIDIVSKKGLESFFTLVQETLNLNEIYVLDKSKKSLRHLHEFGKKIEKKRAYDIYYSLPHSFSSAFLGKSIHAKNRIGYPGDMRTLFLTKKVKKVPTDHNHESYLRLLGDTLKFDKKNYDLKQYGEKDGETIVININSEASSRRLSLELWTNIIEKIHTQKPYQFVFIGSGKEAEGVENFTVQLKKKGIQCENVAGKTTIPELYALFLKSALLISNDSGPAHLANLAHTPLIVFFGAGDSRKTGPIYTENSKVIKQAMPCSPCIKNTCQFNMPRCIDTLNSDMIVDEALKLLKYEV